jgi:hypothetical protein
MNVRDEMEKRGQTMLFARECSLCHYPLVYERIENDKEHLIMNTGCDCVNYNSYVIHTWEQVQAFFDMQCDEVKQGYIAKWGWND